MRVETNVTFGAIWSLTGEQHTVGHDRIVCIECPDDYDVDALEAGDIVGDSDIRMLTADEAIEMYLEG